MALIAQRIATSFHVLFFNVIIVLHNVLVKLVVFVSEGIALSKLRSMSFVSLFFDGRQRQLSVGPKSSLFLIFAL